MKINFEEIRKQNWDEGENRLYEIIKNYEQNDLAALAVNYFHDLCTKRIESEILKAENESLRKQSETVKEFAEKLKDTIAEEIALCEQKRSELLYGGKCKKWIVLTEKKIVLTEQIKMINELAEQYGKEEQ